MNITEAFQENVIIVSLDGRFDANTSDAVEQFLRVRISESKFQFVLDMANVPYISSAGLRVILAVVKELRRDNKGDLRIANLQKTVAKVFEISGLNNVLGIFKNPDSAIQSFTD
ncbi:MAG: STAS domain-containing protein [Candidatus Hatepunaea meridiana]|nr:STAS domain-containing protein [Candidatus Hatepunaea meridiana]